ncbi:MAG: RNA methyltransferase [Candidatus Marinimicrobia bacterium]|nr:RNA methyltransferase [Candidatus Neomarinimicrobiota bacterium]
MSIITNFKNNRGYVTIGLDDAKFSENVGGVLRACGNYNAAMVAISGERFKRQRTDTMKAYRHIPLLQVSDLKEVIPYDCVPIAVDLIDGAIPLPTYQHPERAFYIFGAEDATLGKRTLSWCRDVIYIPTNRCMNLAATVNVVLYDRMAKYFIKDKSIASY